MTTTMTFRLDDETNDRLSNLAGATDRSKSYLALQALKLFLENMAGTGHQTSRG